MSDLIPPMDSETPRRERKNRHYGRWILSLIGTIILVLIVVGITGSNKPKNATPATSPFTPYSQTYAPTTAAPSPTIQPATKVEFVISGNVAGSQFGGLDITYGSDSNTHDVSIPALDGRLKYVMHFDGSAQYYSIDVLFSSAGNVSCKIVVLGPYPDVPLTVSKGSSSAGNNGGDCSAQAAPNNSNGTSWDNEQ